MKIGIFTIMLHNGGTERVIANLSRIWSSQGHKIVFFTQQQPVADEFLHECVSRECAVNGCWLADDADRLQKKYNIDLLVVNGGWNNYWLTSVIRRFKELQVKTMVILHHAINNWAFSGGNAEDFDKEELLKFLDCLVCVDKIQALWWSRRFSKVFYIPNPVSIDPIQSVVGKTQSSNALVWVGRADDHGKRVELAIAAFRIIKDRIPDATLSIVGFKPRGCLVEFPGLEYVGRVPDTRPYLEKAVVNLLTTLWEVTVPQVVLEAGVMGLPTVAIDLPILRNPYLNGASIGGVVLAQDVADMAEKTIALLQNKDLRLSIGAEAKVDVEKRADPNCIEKAWSTLFDAVSQDCIIDYAAEKKKEFETIEIARSLIDEIQRSEAFMVKTQLPILQRIRLWKGRLQGLKWRLGL